jgi:glucosamine--fructose-6-phosphate aminotransferase (isomerizing)
MHYTWREINEQPEVIERIANFDGEELIKAAEIIRDARECYIIGSGSSLNTGMYGGYLLSENNRRENRIIPSSEFNFRATMISGGDVVIALSQSGESGDILEAIRFAKSKMAEVVLITNNNRSEAAQDADICLPLGAGEEQGIVATKTVVGEIAMLIMLSSSINNDTSGGKKILSKVATGTRRALTKQRLRMIKEMAVQYKDAHDFYVIGDNIFFPVALEMALKIKEGGHAHAEGFDGSEFRHGPITLIENNSPVIYFSADDTALENSEENLNEIKKAGGRIVGIGTRRSKLYDDFYQLGQLGPYSVVEAVLFAQIFAYFLAVERGLDPDKPAHLSKVVK